MVAETKLTVGERLEQLLDQLGLPQAHFCVRMPADLLDLAARAPGRIASIIVQGHGGGDPRALGPFVDRTRWVRGNEGTFAKQFAQSVAELAGANVHWLQGYTDNLWSDTVADRTAEVAEAMLTFLAQMDAVREPPRVTIAGEGTIAGVTYTAAGSGTPVILLPLGLAAQQWEPLLPLLQASHCTFSLGGSYLSPVALLENRAAGDYSRMALDCLNLAAPQTGEALIEVGCGSGPLLRRLGQRTGLARLAGLDVNRFMLREGRALAEAEGFGQRLEWHEGAAEAMPLPDDTFDIAFSSTMLEEVDADRVLAEMVRITKPGGRVVVVVRAVDLPWWTNLPLPQALAEKVLAASGSVTEKACADGSLLRRLRAAGLREVRGGPTWFWTQPSDPIWEFLEAGIRSDLTADEIETWSSALAAAGAEALPISLAWPHHCALGVK